MTVKRCLMLLALIAVALPAPAALAQRTQVARDYWPTEGWRSAAPEEHDVDPGLLDEADRVIRAELPDVTGLVVVRHGYVLYERYYGAYGQDDPVKVRSVTKSVVSTLIGIAQEEGALSLDQPIGDLIPDRLPPDADPRTAEITVEQLLTMTGGFEWSNGNDYQRLIAADDWVGLTLRLPVIYEPGTFFTYNSGGSHLLSVILTAATGEDTTENAQEHLFTPLGIEEPTWARSPQDEAIGGFGLELTPRDMAKLGYLYLNEGRWGGEQIVPREYVELATTRQSDGDSTGGTPYGYQWWVTEVGGHAAYFALGFGGQYVYVVPDLDLVVVLAAGFETPPPVLRSPRFIVESLVVPAVLDQD